MKVVLLVLAGLFVLSSTVSAYEFNFDISTPLGNDELDQELWQDTWQREVIIYAGSFTKFCNKLGRFGLWYMKEKIKEEEKEAQKQNQSEDPLERRYLQKFNVYEELSKEATDIKEIEQIIEHIEIYGYEKYGDNLNKKFKELHDDLIHIRDTHYNIIQTGNTITVMGILALLARLGQLAILGV